MGKKRVYLFVCLICIFIVRSFGAVHNILPTASEYNYLKAIANMTNTVSLDTQYYNHPDNIILIPGFVIINLIALITKGTLCTGPVSLVLTGSTDPTYFADNFEFYLSIARVINVLFSILAIYFIYKIAETIKNNAGIWAAIFASVFPSYNVWSGCVLSDTAVTAIAAAAIYFSIQYMKTREKRFLYVTTCLCGVCTMQKYTGLLTCMLVVWLVIYDHIADIKNFGKFLGTCVVDGIKLIAIYIMSIIICAPNVVTNFGRVVQILITEARPYQMRADGLGFFGNILFYINTYWTQMGLWLSLLCIIGVVFLVKNKNISYVY